MCYGGWPLAFCWGFLQVRGRSGTGRNGSSLAFPCLSFKLSLSWSAVANGGLFSFPFAGAKPMPEEAGTLFDVFSLTGIRYWRMQVGGGAEAAQL